MSATLPKSPDALMTVRERHLKVPIVLAIAAARSHPFPLNSSKGTLG